jgi:hypothetical protein
VKNKKVVPDHINPAYVTDEAMGTLLDVRSESLREVLRDAIDQQRKNPAKARKVAMHDPFLDQPGDPFYKQPLPRQVNLRETVIPELLDVADEEIKRVLREHGVQDSDEIDQSKPSQVFVRVGDQSIEAEVFRSGDVWMCRANGKKYVGDSRDDAMIRCSQALKQEARTLTESERLEIARLAASGANPGNGHAILQAISRYVEKMTGAKLQEAYVDPAHLPVVDEAVKFCWEQASPGFSAGPDWDGFLTSYAQGRPYTLAIVASAAQSYLKTRDDKAFDRTLNGSAREWMEELRPAPPTPLEMEDMSDEEIRDLMRSAGREAARR